MRLLSFLLDILFPPRDTMRLVREATPAFVAALIKERTHVRTGYTITTLLPYRHPLIRALIIQTKFGDDQEAAVLLAEVLRTYLEHRDVGCTVLVPIPLSRERLRERGYNQVERVVRMAIADREDLSLSSTLLSRRRDTHPQTALAKSKRGENLRDAFYAHPCDPQAEYLIIDDVLTTGATMQEAVHALKEAGAMHINALALAH